MTVPVERVRGPALRPADRAIRALRIRAVRPFVPAGSRVLDVGCYDGSLFAALSDRVASGVGLDPALLAPRDDGRFRYLADTFPSDAIDEERFDVVTMLAVLEHVPDTDIPTWAEACSAALTPDGIVVATVPDPRIDGLLHGLTRLRLVAGMSADEHHGADPMSMPNAFAAVGLGLRIHRRFELGLNHLFVFERCADADLTTSRDVP
jgi:2-polyprenyl-3-methyl-5-hydroxy-6-metoxy-1,4-benzoquinol methylase